MQERIRAFVQSIVPVASIVEIEVPKIEKYGDYSTNIAIVLSKTNNISPRLIASDLTARLKELDKGNFSSIETAGAGFINFKISD